MGTIWIILAVTLGSGTIGWLLHAAKQRYGCNELRTALYRELARNYAALVSHSSDSHTDLTWFRANLKHELSFHAHKLAAGNPKAFYRIPEYEWFERSFSEMEKCTALLDDDNELVRQLRRGTDSILGIGPPADSALFRSMLPSQYALHIK